MAADAPITAFADEVGTEGSVTVAGGRTRWLLGGAIDPGTREVTAPSGIVSYRPEEMIVRVRAGTSVAELDSALEACGQRCALPDRGGTVGGALVVGENDLCRLGRGAVRDALLQVTYVDAEARVVTGGGPVVKNVSGFNIPKLFVGSLGTLGLVAECVLRTNPKPAVQRWLVSDDVDPMRVPELVLRPGAVLTDGIATWVLLEGHGVDVEAEAQSLASAGTFDDADGPPVLPDHRWSLRPDELAAIDRGVVGDYVASVGVGTVFASNPQPERFPDDASQIVARRLKQLFDPAGRLNPGRTVGW